MSKHIAVLMIAIVLAAQGQVYVSAPSTGTAVPASAGLTGTVSSGNLAGLIACDSSVALSMNTSTTTQAIALQSGKSIYVCGFVINAGGTTTGRLVQGTGGNCAAGQSNVTPVFNLINGASVAHGSGVGMMLKTNAGSALCVTNTSGNALNVLITYTQY
jgi:hypothetical protein